MLCTECQDKLSDYLDNDLNDRERTKIEAHLKTCPPCAVLRDDLARIIEASGQLPLHTPSRNVWERIHAEIAAESNVVAGPQSWWDRFGKRTFNVSFSGRQLAASAAAVVIAVSAFWTIRAAGPTALPAGSADWGNFSTATGKVDATPLAQANAQREAELNQLKSTVDEMARLVSQHQSKWSTELRETFQKKVAELDTRIGDSERAFASDHTENSRNRVFGVYREKLELLDEFAKIGK